MAFDLFFIFYQIAIGTDDFYKTGYGDGVNHCSEPTGNPNNLLAKS